MSPTRMIGNQMFKNCFRLSEIMTQRKFDAVFAVLRLLIIRLFGATLGLTLAVKIFHSGRV